MKVIKYHGVEFLPVSDERLLDLGSAPPPDTVEEEEVYGMAIGLLGMRQQVRKAAKILAEATSLKVAQEAIVDLAFDLAQGDPK